MRDRNDSSNGSATRECVSMELGRLLLSISAPCTEHAGSMPVEVDSLLLLKNSNAANNIFRPNLMCNSLV